ncbi:hypothetical protein F2Q70_00028458 [Brassica cretica]|uniref:Glabrous enhancer-binding protein-like DBD domain-containing protein n=1 Tax=Brassica cretica TaxID=69181 RepID=A0A8S9LIZ7_BRACR|nr:hypothetical protein F2Q70_00028458 [Brassica cretica]
MALGKRTRDYDSNDKPISSSPLRRMQEDDASGMESMLRRRKQPKTTPVSSSSNNKMNWTKDDELIILGSIVDYEKETKLSHRSDWDAFYGYVKDFIEADFSKKQLTDKIRNLNKRFLEEKEKSTEDVGDELCVMKDALTDKEKSEEDSADVYCALKDALEETTFFQSIGKYQQKVLLQNLKNLRGPRRKELADELKELLDEEMKVRAKKLSLTAKLASAWEESLLIQK